MGNGMLRVSIRRQREMWIRDRLDNMTPVMLRKAVDLNKGRAILEASGRVSEDSVVGIAESGVDYISVGAITHSALTLDLGLDIDIS